MRAVLDKARDLWCAVTRTCVVRPPNRAELYANDADLQWMAAQEQASVQALRRRRQRRQNFLESELTRTRREGQRREC